MGLIRLWHWPLAVCVFVACMSFGHIIAKLSQMSNGCLMTWMRPRYTVVEEVRHATGRYKLSRYTEAYHVADLERNEVGVIFVPGNSGSAHQVRALAGETLRAERSSSVRFTFFTVDFQEDFSAFDASLLDDQADFVARCIRWMHATMSNGSHKPHAIIAIGHSMGGIVARAAIARANQDINHIALLLTFATPHRQPPLPFLPSMVNFYAHQANLALPGTAVISIFGGTHDVQIPDAMAQVPESVGLSLGTIDISGVWVTADHQCIVWCNQLTQRIGTALAHTMSSLFARSAAMHRPKDLPTGNSPVIQDMLSVLRPEPCVLDASNRQPDDAAVSQLLQRTTPVSGNFSIALRVDKPRANQSGKAFTWQSACGPRLFAVEGADEKADGAVPCSAPQDLDFAAAAMRPGEDFRVWLLLPQSGESARLANMEVTSAFVPVKQRAVDDGHDHYANSDDLLNGMNYLSSIQWALRIPSSVLLSLHAQSVLVWVADTVKKHPRPWPQPRAPARFSATTTPHDEHQTITLHWHHILRRRPFHTEPSASRQVAAAAAACGHDVIINVVLSPAVRAWNLAVPWLAVRPFIQRLQQEGGPDVELEQFVAVEPNVAALKQKHRLYGSVRESLAEQRVGSTCTAFSLRESCADTRCLQDDAPVAVAVVPDCSHFSASLSLSLQRDVYEFVFLHASTLCVFVVALILVSLVALSHSQGAASALHLKEHKAGNSASRVRKLRQSPRPSESQESQCAPPIMPSTTYEASRSMGALARAVGAEMTERSTLRPSALQPPLLWGALWLVLMAQLLPGMSLDVVGCLLLVNLATGWVILAVAAVEVSVSICAALVSRHESRSAKRALRSQAFEGEREVVGDCAAERSQLRDMYDSDASHDAVSTVRDDGRCDKMPALMPEMLAMGEDSFSFGKGCETGNSTPRLNKAEGMFGHGNQGPRAAMYGGARHAVCQVARPNWLRVLALVAGICCLTWLHLALGLLASFAWCWAAVVMASVRCRRGLGIGEHTRASVMLLKLWLALYAQALIQLAPSLAACMRASAWPCGASSDALWVMPMQLHLALLTLAAAPASLAGPASRLAVHATPVLTIQGLVVAGACAVEVAVIGHFRGSIPFVAISLIACLGLLKVLMQALTERRSGVHKQL